MITIKDVRKSSVEAVRLPAVSKDAPSVEGPVRRILEKVRKEGDAALRFYSKKFDGVSLTALAVPAAEIAAAQRNADPAFLRVLKRSAANITRFHRAQQRRPFTVSAPHGSQLQQIYRSVERAGVYVPGGKAAYPSTVLMNVIPALVAGVSEVHLVSPPDAHGNIHPDVLTAASLLGVKHVYRIGGAQAIAALAFGTETVPAVDKIVGPGNIFVATAKRLVYGTVGIDSFAGPSEVLILADDTAEPSFVAADLLAQAEHDERAVPILVTPSRTLAHSVRAEVQRMLERSDRRRILEASIKGQGRIYLVASMKQGIALTNRFAPEHLEIITKRDREVLAQIRHAGSIFLGNHSPVAIGDYFAGPNHVLPTEGTARFSSPLSVDDFIKRSSVIRYTAAQMREVADAVASFAEREGLSAHAASLRIRKQGRA
ncbi:MAG: histidinol dehydrogenase [Bacteroidetes bacterium]|nr:histidinol dehydrogenase [Bacteroidota bacterium]